MTYVNEKMRLNKHKNVFIPRNKELYETFKPKDNSTAYYGENLDTRNMSKLELYQSALDYDIAEKRKQKQREAEESRKKAEKASESEKPDDDQV